MSHRRRGLAGTALGWALHERGAPFVIVDPNEKQTCSRIAAGLVTPITGKRVKPSWRVDELLPVALEHYRKVEKLLGRRVLPRAAAGAIVQGTARGGMVARARG